MCALLRYALVPFTFSTERKFAEEDPTLRVESYELSKTLRWCERLINSIMIDISFLERTQLNKPLQQVL